MQSIRLRKPHNKGDGPPVFSHEFIIQNHADIISCVVMVVFIGLIPQVVNPLASSIIFVHYNETVEPKDVESAPGKAELESRLRELTESLIQKQTTLETLSSEKSSLNVQLQRMKSELSEAKKIYPHRTSQTVVNGLESVESEARMRSVTPIMPSVDSNGHLHNVRRAVNSVDRVSIWLGVFLRRYPYARLFAILYMVLLHIWIMVILLTYTPEIHDIKSL